MTYVGPDGPAPDPLAKPEYYSWTTVTVAWTGSVTATTIARGPTTTGGTVTVVVDVPHQLAVDASGKVAASAAVATSPTSTLAATVAAGLDVAASVATASGATPYAQVRVTAAPAAVLA